MRTVREIGALLLHYYNEAGLDPNSPYPEGEGHKREVEWYNEIHKWDEAVTGDTFYDTTMTITLDVETKEEYDERVSGRWAQSRC